MYGIIDIGSNTMRLSCYRVVDKTLISVFHKKAMAGLAGYVDENKNLSQEGINKAIKTLEDFQKIVMCVGMDNLYVIATASFRNVENTKEIVAQIRERTGMEVQVLSGEEEAICDFNGARYNDRMDDGMVIDIGGGSTELVPFRGDHAKHAVSIPLGSLNLFSKYVEELFPDKSEELQIRARVRKELDKLDMEAKKEILGVGGSNRACLKLYNNYYKLDDSNRKMECEKIHTMLAAFCANNKMFMRRILKIVPDRIHTVIPGMLVLDEICSYYKCRSVKVTNWGVREGYLIEKVL
ncbi:MAG: hypothetical protein ACI39W_01355 [Brotaphodocola sp.]